LQQVEAFKVSLLRVTQLVEAS